MSIPHESWQALSLPETLQLFANAPFQWCIAGGYAIEQFAGFSFRAHGDMDVLVYRDEQLAVQAWLKDWQLYAADPPGTLRVWQPQEYLATGIHNIWGHRIGSQSWELQLMLMETEGEDWFYRRYPAIRGKQADLITRYHDVPCLRVEIQLLYKSKGLRAKDELDFQTCLPLLSQEAKAWLATNIRLTNPEHPWLNLLDAPNL